MDKVELLGLFAGTCTTFAFLPQVFQIWKTRSVKDISLSMYIVFIAGVTSWIFYGIFRETFSLVLANVITLVLAVAILVMKLRWAQQQP